MSLPVDGRRSVDPADAGTGARPCRHGVHAARAPPTATPPCSPGSARICSPAGGCASGARPTSPPSGRGAPCAVGDDAVLLVRGDDGVLRGFYNVCQHRAHELLPCGATSQHRSIHCPYHGWRYGLDGTLLSTPRFDEPAGFDTLGARARPGRRARSGTAGSWSTPSGDGAAGRRVPRRHRRRTSPTTSPERLVVGATHTLRAGGQLEADRRELPGVLPLPEHPPRAVRGEPADERRELHGPRRDVGRRLAGPDAGRRHDVARRASPARVPLAQPARRRAAGASTTSDCCRTCSSACTPTT